MTSQPQGEKPERYGIWKCPLCFWQGLELKESEVLSYHDRFHSKQGSHCVCLDFDLVVEMDQPATPSADEEIATPLCNALGIDEWTLPDNRLVVSIRWKDLARQLERDIIKTARCFAEATSQLASLQSEREKERLATDSFYEQAAANLSRCKELERALAERDRERGTLNPAK